MNADACRKLRGSMSSRRRLRRRVLAVLLGTIVALLAAEVLYRLTRVPGLSPTTHPGYVMHDDQLGWRYRPGARARHASAEFDVAIEINAQGFRGPDWPATRDARPLVLVLGDSMVFGWGVEEHEGLCGLLRAQNAGWDVRGAGISGYAPDQQLLLLRRLCAEFRPDVVVCVSTANDVYEVASDVMYGLRKPRFVVDGKVAKLLAPAGPENFLHAHSMLFRALNKMWWSWQFARVTIIEDWELVFALYRSMRAELSSAFVLVAGDDALRDFAHEERDVVYVDLKATMPAGASAWAFPVDGHWTAAGHARVATAVAAAIVTALEKR